MKMKCKRCRYEWDYKGTSQFYTSCPRCRSNIKVVDENERRNKKFKQDAD